MIIAKPTMSSGPTCSPRAIAPQVTAKAGTTNVTELAIVGVVVRSNRKKIGQGRAVDTVPTSQQCQQPGR